MMALASWGRRLWSAWRRRTWAERWLVLETVIWLGVARTLVLLVPFRWLIRLAGLQLHVTTAPPLAAPPEAVVGRIRRTVAAVSRYTPWDSNCLAQALAAHQILRRHHVSAQLYVGVAKHEAQSLEAHAWLRCGDLFVTGEGTVQRFTVVAQFTSIPARSAPSTSC